MQINYKSQIFLQYYLISFSSTCLLHIIQIFHVLAAEIIADLQIKMLLLPRSVMLDCFYDSLTLTDDSGGYSALTNNASKRIAVDRNESHSHC